MRLCITAFLLSLNGNVVVGCGRFLGLNWLDVQYRLARVASARERPVVIFFALWVERKRTSVLVDKIAVLCSHVSAPSCMLLVLAQHLEGMLPVLDLYDVHLV